MFWINVNLRVYNSMLQNNSMFKRQILHTVDRLTSLDLPSLLYRFKRGDLIFLHKLLNGVFNLDYLTYFYHLS